ncbi:hypothetical protein BGW39_009615 [Mortierella sp. 14UC]|nr:hypothetical protein BGW39_009615 [Mortierella sp. 14UC]
MVAVDQDHSINVNANDTNSKADQGTPEDETVPVPDSDGGSGDGGDVDASVDRIRRDHLDEAAGSTTKSHAQEGSSAQENEDVVKPDLSAYRNLEAAKHYSDDELAEAMTPERVAWRMRLRRELMDSLKGIPIPTQPLQGDKLKVAGKANVKRDAKEGSPSDPETDGTRATKRSGTKGPERTLSDLYTSLPLSPSEVHMIMRKRRHPTPTAPIDDLRRLAEFLTPVIRDPFAAHRQGQSNIYQPGQSRQRTKFCHLHAHEKGDSNNETAATTEDSRKRSRKVSLVESPVDKSTTTQVEPPLNQQDGPKNKKRAVRAIPGRFSAMDSSDEEQAQAEYDREVAKRKASQIKLYNPKVDEILEWTTDHDWKPDCWESWRCPACDQRPKKSSDTCTFCGATKPGPCVENTIPISVLLAMEKEVKEMA